MRGLLIRFTFSGERYYLSKPVDEVMTLSLHTKVATEPSTATFKRRRRGGGKWRKWLGKFYAVLFITIFALHIFQELIIA